MVESESRDERDSLESYLFKLQEELKALRSERAKLESHTFLLQKKYVELKREYDRLVQPPLMVGTVVDVLPNYQAVVKNSNGVTFLVNVLSSVYDSLRPGQQVALSQQTLAVVGILPEQKDERVRAFEIIERPNVTYKDIGGLEDVIQELREVVELPLKKPEVFKQMGIQPPKGVLLYGPPGTGKTLLAKAVAHETNATFIHVVGSELVRKFIGEGAKLVRDLFKLAREKAPSIIFIDEIDAIGAVRTEALTGGDREVQRTLVQLLAEMDGFRPLEGVAVIAATNRIDILDPALLRPGRFDRVIEVPLPDEKARYEILKVLTRNVKLSKSVDLRKIAKITAGASGADLKAIVTEAGMLAIRRGHRSITEKDIRDAMEKIKRTKVEKGPEHIYL
ncbi:MAG: proteasome regulatory subunit [Candidatus Diapherotrites archaeon]|nr:proteasome regulatory subunit [Candidatus Diapherotrites archaeon]MDN5366645.1 proteasome regulatory subunit [Candidatus Diapherotrites archaeon]